MFSLTFTNIYITQIFQVHYMYKATNSIALLKVENCIDEAIRKAVKYLETECGSTVSEVSGHL